MRIKNCDIKVIQGDITKLKVDAIVDAANNELLTFKTDEQKVRNACRSALKAAEELKIKSIAFPALGCGTGGFEALASAKIMAQEVFRHLNDQKSSLEEIIFCLYDKDSYNTFNKGVISYLEHVVNDLGKGPFSTVDIIIEADGGVVLIKRSNPPFGWALPGGFVDRGESLEDAAMREAREETGLEVTDLKQFHTYSKADRDPRFHTIATVFTAKAKGKPKAGDDAASVKVVKFEEIEGMEFAFDHRKILEDYLEYRKRGNPFVVG